MEQNRHHSNEETYTTGAFARLAKTTPRTLRFYDQKGLLKPSAVSSAGYRLYTREDLGRLQKILLFKSLGFSLEQISFLLLDQKDDLLPSLQLQSRLVLERMDHLRRISETLDGAIRDLEQGEEQPEIVESLIDLIAQDDQLADQYKNARNLSSRIRLHNRYSVNPQGWFDWVYSWIPRKEGNRILEVGCGDGTLWKKHQEDLKNMQLTLSDLSDGMVREARKNLDSGKVSALVFNAQDIPFHEDSFEVVIANHMLFYLSDLRAGLSEMSRVLTDNGLFMASAYGKNHLQEIRMLVQEFDPEISLSSSPLYEAFGLENGKRILEDYFEEVSLELYPDRLEVTDASDLAEYILSCHGNQNERLVGCYERFMSFLEERIRQTGKITITKQAGVFLCRKPKHA